ncbi:MAG: Gldg family protein [Gammaproteobacteria bacterium]
MHDVLRVARKEMATFFASPVAYLFLAAFLAVNLFIFFWVATFFARNIADVQPLFQWMPVLLIFLVAAVTMRLWSEERRAGTLEMLLTAPVSPTRLVLGKFVACLALVAIALALTLPLPVTVSFLGPLDWGPVVGAYIASLFLAAAYIAIGLYVSSRSENQIVSLLGTVLICAVFYLIGTNAIAGLFGYGTADFLKLLGTGSRFDSITRGVIDVRDLYYYISIVGVFLTLNVFSLERLRWAAAGGRSQRHQRWRLVAALFIANFVIGNVWLQQINWARADITQGHIYSISAATRHYLSELQEPLLIRGYFSAHTHPLLAPLVPQLRDLLKEYAVAGHGRVHVQFVDPEQHPDMERVARQKYGIKPVAFRVANKYQSGVVTSYFNILIKYGDQYQVLGYRDLIDVKQRGATGLDVRLRNPEYQITRSIKKVLYGYQGGGDLFASIHKPVTFHGYISATAKLPKQLLELRAGLQQVLAKMQRHAHGKLKVDIRDPEANGGALAKQIATKYGYRPLALGLLDPHRFYFYMMLQSGDQTVPVPLPRDLTTSALKHSIQAGLKRFAAGFLRTIALYTPGAGTGGYAMPGESYRVLKQKLREDAVVRTTSLKSGRVPDSADLLLVISPEHFSKRQVFAVDQFLMRGGTVIIAASPYQVNLGGGRISAQREPTGLGKWLQAEGVHLKHAMVLDPQNTPFPIPVNRNVGGLVVQEIRSVDYPYFADIRRGGMDHASGITAGIDQLTMNWASPVVLDPKLDKGRKVIRLLHTSDASWTSPSANVEPDFRTYRRTGFPPAKHRGPQLVAAAVQGRFVSYFKGKPSPLLAQADKGGNNTGKPAPKPKIHAKDSKHKQQPVISGVIDKSPASARLMVFGSSTFLSDTALDLATSATQTRYLEPVQLIQNAVDWSLEDPALLAIRGRSEYARLLKPMDRNVEMFWEYLNYVLAVVGLFIVYLVERALRKGRAARYRHALSAAGGGA